MDESIKLGVSQNAEIRQDGKRARDNRHVRLAARLGRRAFLGGAVFSLASSIAVWRTRQVYSGRIYPSVSIAEVNVGGLSAHDAGARLQNWIGSLEHGMATLTYDDRIWSPTLRQLGIRIDLETSIQRAMHIGREEAAAERLRSLSGLVQKSKSLPVTVSFDPGTLQQWIDSVDQELGLPPVNAAVSFAADVASLTPEVDGVIVERKRLKEIVLTIARTLEPVESPLPVERSPALVTQLDLADAYDQATEALSKSVKVLHGKRKWTLEPGDLGQFLTIRNVARAAGSSEIRATVDEEELAGWLRELVESDVNADPVDATVAWNQEKGKLVALTSSKEGARLKRQTLAAEVAASFLGDHHDVAVPVKVLKPAVDSDDLQALCISQRVAVGDSSYQGSNIDRATNIEVGAGLLNGTLVPPGEWYSFNQSIGVIDYDKGYVDAAVIAGERIGRDAGGGICQVSTTVFRAAIRAGLPIPEWWPHTYRLGFYELDGWAPGFDASILQPEGDPFGGGDLRFVNPYDSWLFIESYTRDQRVTVVMYGPSNAHTAALSDPWPSDPIPPPAEDIEIVDEELPPGTVQQSEMAQSGLAVSFNRFVYEQSGNMATQDTWYTLFAARPNVWKVSPDMQGQSPA